MRAAARLWAFSAVFGDPQSAMGAMKRDGPISDALGV
jgi:hypothetical protein